MKIKYARFDDNKIIKVECEGNYIYWMNEGKRVGIRKDRVPVADTPQELIEVDDLVEDATGFIMCVGEIDDKGYMHQKDPLNLLNEPYITSCHLVEKICTSNSNGDYIKQWEAE